MRIVSNIRGLCCRVCLDDVWQLLRELFNFPRRFGLMVLSRDVPENRGKKMHWNDSLSLSYKSEN